MNLIDQGAKWLADKANASAGRPVTYRRGVGVSVPFVATREAEDEQAVDSDGAYIIVRQHTFKFKASDLGFEPRAGDRIEELIGTNQTLWEVMPRGGGTAWQWDDAAGIRYRVFVKQVD
jgi:hypothetical protein